MSGLGVDREGGKESPTKENLARNLEPKRIQLRRTKGWRLPEGAIVVGRPSKWGNPFAVGTRQALARVPALDGSPWEYEGRISADGIQHDYQHADGHWTRHTIRYMTRVECVELYRRALLGELAPEHIWIGGRQRLNPEIVRAELAGHDLACWCPPFEACHADVLLEVANATVSA